MGNSVQFMLVTDKKRGDSYFNPTEPPEVCLDPTEPME